MKQTFLFSLFSILGFYADAQKYIVTPNGLVNADDTTKRYVVIYIDSLSAKELYKRSYKFIGQTWKNPEIAKDGKKEGEYLYVRIFAKNALTAKGSFGIKFNLDLRYSLHLNFKDDKIKYEIVDLEMNDISPYSEDTPFYIKSNSALSRSIFDKDGTLIEKQKSVKKQLENYFNNQITELKDQLIAASSKVDF
jgi:hypothetical protein